MAGKVDYIATAKILRRQMDNAREHNLDGPMAIALVALDMARYFQQQDSRFAENYFFAKIGEDKSA